MCTYNGLSNAGHVLGDRILQREFRVEARSFPLLLYRRKFKGDNSSSRFSIGTLAMRDDTRDRRNFNFNFEVVDRIDSRVTNASDHY